MKRNPMARDLRQPKYRPRVVEDQSKKIFRQRKHKKNPSSNHEN